MKCNAGHFHNTAADVVKCNRDAEVKAQIAASRAVLRSRAAVKHDHRLGDDKCPVCARLRTNEGAF